MTPLLHSINDAAAVIGQSRSRLYELIATGDIETVTVGRRRLVPHAALETYVARLRAPAGTSAA